MPAACVQAWIDKHQGKHVYQCGCGEVIQIMYKHKYSGIPKCKWDHKSVARWIRKHQGKHLCGCGCGEAIPIVRSCKYIGIPKFKQYHSILDKWVRQHQGKHFCKCGCRQAIKILRPHKRNGIPKYIKHHHTPVAATVYKWIEANQGKHFCECGCGKPITIIGQHHTKGISRFIHGHSKGLRSLWIKREQGNHPCACGCGEQIKIIGDHKKRGIPKFILGHNCQGASNPAWRGGLSKTYANRRRAIISTHWREQILTRDNFQCAFGCPKNSPGPLHAHHIIGFARQPELADKLWNGITLCEACHYAIKCRETEYEDFFFNILSEASHGCASC